MERNTSFESRNKRQLQSDGEARRRHKGGAQAKRHQNCKNGEDIKMETVIYKLDSKNKIVLPAADNTNANEELLKYVRNRIEQNSSTHNYHNDEGRNHGKGRSKRDRACTWSKCCSRDSETSLDEDSSTRVGNKRRNKMHKHSSRKRRYHSDEDDEHGMPCNNRKNHITVNRRRNVDFCNCRRAAAMYDPTKILTCLEETQTNERAFANTELTANANGQTIPNEHIVCEGDEEQMLKCLQAVFQKLCALSNIGGARVEIDVQNMDDTPAESNTAQTGKYAQSVENYAVQDTITTLPYRDAPLQQQQLPVRRSVATAANSPHHFSINSNQSNPNGFTYPSHQSTEFSEPIETRILGKQFGNTVEPPQHADRHLHYNQQQQQQQLSGTLGNNPGYMENYPTEFSGLRPAFFTQPQTPADVQSNTLQPDVAPQQENANLFVQQYNPQFDTQTTAQLSVERTSNQSAIAQQQQQQQQQQNLGSMSDRYSQSVSAQYAENSRTQNSNDMSVGGAGTSMQSYPKMQPFIAFPATPPSPSPPLPTASGVPPFVTLPQQTMQDTPKPSYPLYPYGPKNGLQSIPADNVRYIPNMRIVDYNQNGYGCGCPPTISTPTNNDSYEYILMRVRKDKRYCAM